MKKFNIDLVAECEVSFSDEDLVQAFFIESQWRESFYDFEDLGELAGFIGESLIDGDKIIDGFTDFSFNNEGELVSKYKDYGSIIVKVISAISVDEVYEEKESIRERTSMYSHKTQATVRVS